MIEKIDEIEFKEYEKLINITLFNEIIAFIVNTRSNKETSDILQEIQNKCIWYDVANESNLQTKYNIEYFFGVGCAFLIAAERRCFCA